MSDYSKLAFEISSLLDIDTIYLSNVIFLFFIFSFFSLQANNRNREREKLDKVWLQDDTNVLLEG